MYHNSSDDIVSLLKDDFESLARYLLGEPNRILSSARNLRYGTNGSLSVELDGSKRGLYFDNEAQTGGGPIELIRRERGGSVAEAFEFARQWLGLDGTKPAKKSRPEPPPKPVPTEPEPDKTAHAKAMWAGTVPLTGTIGERYLVEHRGVPADSIANLEPLVRFHPAYRANATTRISNPALVVLATDSDGIACAIQAVRLQADGRKFTGPVPKISNGVLAGAAVRVPGAGELILIEGPEKGFVAWAATGRPVWVALGSLEKIAAQVPDGTAVTLSRDQDKPDSPADRTFRKTCDALTARGCRVAVTCPPVSADGAKVDWDDVARRDGIAAVKAAFDGAEAWVATEAADPLDEALGAKPKTKPGLLDSAAHFPAPDMAAAAAGGLLRHAVVEYLDAVELATRINRRFAADFEVAVEAAKQKAATDATHLVESVWTDLGDDATDYDINLEIYHRAKLKPVDDDETDAEARVERVLFLRALSFPLIITRLKIPLSKRGIAVAIQKNFVSVEQAALRACWA